MDERLRALGCKEFDVAEYLDTPERIAAYLSDAMADGDHGYLTHALELAAPARAMHALVPEAGRELGALGMKLQVAAV